MFGVIEERVDVAEEEQRAYEAAAEEEESSRLVDRSGGEMSGNTQEVSAEMLKIADAEVETKEVAAEQLVNKPETVQLEYKSVPKVAAKTARVKLKKEKEIDPIIWIYSATIMMLILLIVLALVYLRKR